MKELTKQMLWWDRFNLDLLERVLEAKRKALYDTEELNESNEDDSK